MSRIIVDAVRNSSASSDGITLASDGSVTFPNNATCSGTATGFGGGKLLKVENFVYQGNSSISSTNDAFVATPIYCSITPSAASSKIFVTYSLAVGPADGVRGGTALYRNINNGGWSIVSGLQATANGSNQRGSGITNGPTQYTPVQNSNSFLDTPSYSVGNAIEYKIYMWAETSTAVWINRIYANDSTNTNYGVGCSTISLMEIAA